MRMLQIGVVSLLLVSPMIAQAQIAGARPGHVPGVGESMPLSDNASNIDKTDSTAATAPRLPSPGLGEAASPADYLTAARAALVAGRTGEAQQSLEMAETRALNRSVVATQVSVPSANPMVAHISGAIDAVGHGDKANALRQIDLALVQ